MRVNVKRIPARGETLRGKEPASIMDLDESDVHFQHEVEYDLLAQVQGNALLVIGKLQTPATLRCSRCLRVFDQILQVQEFVFHQELHGEDFVDLTANLREDIILELPQRALCDPDCKGLCPRCGQNLNEVTCRCVATREDLRWQALDRLKLD